jgi:hypothetical protein
MLKKLELQLLLNKQKRILKLRQGLKIKWKLILLTKGQKLVFKWFKPQKQFKKKKQLSRKYSRICISSQMELIEFFRGSSLGDYVCLFSAGLTQSEICWGRHLGI